MKPNELIDGHYDLTSEKIDALYNRFKQHPHKEGQSERYQQIRHHAKVFASLVLQCVPDSREQSIALTKIEEVMFWSNAGIARNE